MNIQIYGKNKCFNTKAAERFFKERKIKFQFIDLLDKGLSIKELDSIVASVKDVDLLFDKKSAPYESLNVAFITRTIEAKKTLLLENPKLIATPIVRDCQSRKCTVGDGTNEWKSWQ